MQRKGFLAKVAKSVREQIENVNISQQKSSIKASRRRSKRGELGHNTDLLPPCGSDSRNLASLHVSRLIHTKVAVVSMNYGSPWERVSFSHIPFPMLRQI